MSKARVAGPIKDKLPHLDGAPINVNKHRFREFELAGKVYVVTGGAQGLGLSLAEALVEAGSTGKFIPNFYSFLYLRTH